jgi:hypothetical protein
MATHIPTPPRLVRWDEFVRHDGLPKPFDPPDDPRPEAQLRNIAQSLGAMNARGAFETLAAADRKTVACLPLVLYSIAGEIAPPRPRLSRWARFRNAVMRRLP